VIAHLSGEVLRAGPDFVVLDVGGVGYMISVALPTRQTVPAPGGKLELHIHTHVREDQLALYGFASAAELDLFEMLIGVDGGGWATLQTTLDLAAVALANEQVGGAQKVLEMSVEYAKVRVQFGRPIGSFQAIKHKCADMLLEVESAKSAAYYAAWAAAEDNDELPVVASLAKAYCSDAYFHAAAENIQIHGGIGFTWEHDAHLYFKRAKSSEILLGDATYHRELLAQRIGI
jgi:hypothetical protein